jgi:nucleotide-binding universal stress UspA family protein
MKTILIPLDGSMLAERVLPYARTLASQMKSDLRLVRAVPDREHDSLFAETMIGTYGIVEPPEALRQRTQRAWDEQWHVAEGYLASRAARLQETGLPVTTDVLVGSPSEAIVEEISSQRVGLIVMATHGYSGLKRWAFGSVTEQVMRTTTTPMFIVSGTLPAPVAKPTIRRILVPLDGSDQARQALPLAIELATATHAELILLEAVASTIETMTNFRPLGRAISHHGEMLDLLHYQAICDLELQARPLRDDGLRVKTAVMNGPAAEVIVDEAALREVDLIVMATHGYSGLKRWALGSVAERVLYTATMPVALVRAPAVESGGEKEATSSRLFIARR